MDLRELNISQEILNTAKMQVANGLLGYQPFIFAEEFETGVGYEFIGGGEGAGFVYCPDFPHELQARPVVRRALVNPATKSDFRAANQSLRDFFESLLDALEEHGGSFAGRSIAEIGCNSGYFQCAAMLRGADQAVGFDRVDYSVPFALMNGILGTDARFIHRPYDPVTGTMDMGGPYDFTISSSVLCHISEPLRMLKLLADNTRRAILVFTLTGPDTGLNTIEYISANRYYRADEFPFGFDMVRVSPQLIRTSLEMLGFSKVVRVEARGMPQHFLDIHHIYVGVRE